MPTVNHAAVWAIGGATVTAIVTRPRGVPEWCWALVGAALLIAGLVPLNVAGRAVWDGLDVYVFLAGMIVLAELARIEGVFEWLASLIVAAAGGSTRKLFAWVYGLGIGVTALLSNEATVLLLTPAVLAMVRRAGAPPLPFAFSCAFVANAASFLLLSVIRQILWCSESWRNVSYLTLAVRKNAASRAADVLYSS